MEQKKPTFVVAEEKFGNLDTPVQDNSQEKVTRGITNCAEAGQKSTEENNLPKTNFVVQDNTLDSTRNAEILDWFREDFEDNMKIKSEKTKKDYLRKLTKRKRNNYFIQRNRREIPNRKILITDAQEDAMISRWLLRRLPNHRNAPPDPEYMVEDDGPDYQNWKRIVQNILNRIVSHPLAYLFQRVDHAALRFFLPVDFDSIQRDLDNGTIHTSEFFKLSVATIFINELRYKKRGGIMYNIIREMQHYALKQMEPLDYEEISIIEVDY